MCESASGTAVPAPRMNCVSQPPESSVHDSADRTDGIDPDATIAALQAEIELLRADVIRWRAIAVDGWSAATGELTKVESESAAMQRRLAELQHQHHVLSGNHHELSGAHHELTVAHHELNVAYAKALGQGGAFVVVPERVARPLRWVRARRPGSAR